jgi:hypothetical protein
MTNEKITINVVVTTQEELARAFRLWNEEYLTNPGRFLGEVDASDDCATLQAKCLIAYLRSLHGG